MNNAFHNPKDPTIFQHPRNQARCKSLKLSCTLSDEMLFVFRPNPRKLEFTDSRMNSANDPMLLSTLKVASTRTTRQQSLEYRRVPRFSFV